MLWADIAGKKRGGGFRYLTGSTENSKYSCIKEKEFWEEVDVPKGSLEKWTRVLWIKYMAIRIGKRYKNIIFFHDSRKVVVNWKGYPNCHRTGSIKKGLITILQN